MSEIEILSREEVVAIRDFPKTFILVCTTDDLVTLAATAVALSAALVLSERARGFQAEREVRLAADAAVAKVKKEGWARDE